MVSKYSHLPDFDEEEKEINTSVSKYSHLPDFDEENIESISRSTEPLTIGEEKLKPIDGFQLTDISPTFSNIGEEKIAQAKHLETKDTPITPDSIRRRAMASSIIAGTAIPGVGDFIISPLITGLGEFEASIAEDRGLKKSSIRAGKGAGADLALSLMFFGFSEGPKATKFLSKTKAGGKIVEGIGKNSLLKKAKPLIKGTKNTTGDLVDSTMKGIFGKNRKEFGELFEFAKKNQRLKNPLSEKSLKRQKKNIEKKIDEILDERYSFSIDDASVDPTGGIKEKGLLRKKKQVDKIDEISKTGEKSGADITKRLFGSALLGKTLGWDATFFALSSIASNPKVQAGIIEALAKNSGKKIPGKEIARIGANILKKGIIYPDEVLDILSGYDSDDEVRKVIREEMMKLGKENEKKKLLQRRK